MRLFISKALTRSTSCLWRLLIRIVTSSLDSWLVHASLVSYQWTTVYLFVCCWFIVATGSHCVIVLYQIMYLFMLCTYYVKLSSCLIYNGLSYVAKDLDCNRKNWLCSALCQEPWSPYKSTWLKRVRAAHYVEWRSVSYLRRTFDTDVLLLMVVFHFLQCKRPIWEQKGSNIPQNSYRLDTPFCVSSSIIQIAYHDPKDCHYSIKMYP